MIFYSKRKHLVLFDGISFNGGSKVATQNIISQLKISKENIHIVTRDPDSWRNQGLSIHGYSEFKCLEKAEHGMLFYLKHVWIALRVMALIVMLRGRITLMGASGPGVDMAIYLVKTLLGSPVIQLVHGPVAKSKTICRCFCLADQVLYLPSTLDSIRTSLSTQLRENEVNMEVQRSAYQTMNNGISDAQWPSKTKNKFDAPHVFWAASLLRWKGINVLAGALSRFNQDITPPTTLCYINPNTTNHEISTLPLHIHRLELYENPENLDKLRAQCNIFISTSKKEPFGLSILEAMAAGLCIVIPRDGAFWDKILKDGVDCIKYAPNDSVDLYAKLLYLQKNIGEAKTLSEKSVLIAQNYRAEETYKPILFNMNKLVMGTESSHSYRTKDRCDQHV
ncbi:MAG: glycosyltransferase family 4 protein [Agarilytica sp.]